MGIVAILYGTFLFPYAFSKYWKRQPIKHWSYRRMYYLFAFIAWGLGFLLMGASDYVEQIKQIAPIVFGSSFILMAFAPCSMDVINGVVALRVGKVLIFIAIGIAYLYSL